MDSALSSMRTTWPSARFASPKCRTAKPSLTTATVAFVRNSSGRDQPARDGLQLEDVREPGIRAVGRHELGLAAGLDRQLAAGVTCRGSEGRRFGDQIGVVAAGDISGAIGFGPQRLYGHDPSGLPVGQRLEQNRLYDAEDGRVGAYPERQRQHGDNEKHRLAHQDAKGKAKVLQNHIGIYAIRVFHRERSNLYLPVNSFSPGFSYCDPR